MSRTGREQKKLEMGKGAGVAVGSQGGECPLAQDFGMGTAR